VTDSTSRCCNAAYILLGLNVLAAVLFNKEADSAQAVVTSLMLDPVAVRGGEVWRLLTYPLISGGSLFWTLLYKVCIYVFFAHAVERIWGTRRFLTLYLGTVLVAGIVAVFLRIGMIGGGIAEITLFFAYGMTFPESEIRLMFLFPVRAKPLAWIAAGAYFLFALKQKLGGMPYMAGLACGVVYVFYVVRAGGGVRPGIRATAQRVSWWMKRKRTQAELRGDAAEKAIAALPLEHIERQVRQIVSRRIDDDRLTEGERLIVETLIQRVDPGKELCAPNREGGEASMCPICEELGVCLRRFLEQRRTIPMEEDQ